MKKINIWSFILSIICILLFFIVSFSGPIDYSLMGIHPLNLVLYITLITFVLGVLSFSGIQDWKGMARSVTTIILTLGLSVFLTFVIFFGNLLS
ncbi:cellulose synthase/poly-beta-1,6-N-acetylglucosamine synthase-like glycosyltransferase [Salibacterium salarium]|nr:cellulose synthase/poly-beta-1,6-N-acetylglucosamine synthase-like glycosyltransferase [Salibacterium salarium]